MTTNNHTPISTGAVANAATFNSPMGELDSAMGDVGNLTTTAATLTGAVNECDGDIGNLASLHTEEKGSIVAVLNELVSVCAGGTSDGISAADTIAVTNGRPTMIIIGSGTINTITPLMGNGYNQFLWIQNEGTWSFGTSGNIKSSYTPASGEVMLMWWSTYDTKWRRLLGVTT